MNTKEITALLSEIVINHVATEHPIHRLSFTYLINYWNKHQSTVKKYLPRDFYFDIDSNKADAVLMIMVSSFLSSQKSDSRSWDREHVRSKYLVTIDGVELIYYPSQKPQRMLVSFSSMGSKSFDRYSRYYDSSESWQDGLIHVFFRDENDSYYLGNDQTPLTGRYSRIIKKIAAINGLTTRDIFTTGSSMGGYAALYDAFS